MRQTRAQCQLCSLLHRNANRLSCLCNLHVHPYAGTINFTISIEMRFKAHHIPIPRISQPAFAILVDKKLCAAGAMPADKKFRESGSLRLRNVRTLGPPQN